MLLVVSTRIQLLPPPCLVPGRNDDDKSQWTVCSIEKRSHVVGHSFNQLRDKRRVRFKAPRVWCKLEEAPNTPEWVIRVQKCAAKATVATVQRRRKAFHFAIEMLEQSVKALFVQSSLEAPSIKRVVPQQQTEERILKRPLILRSRGDRHVLMAFVQLLELLVMRFTQLHTRVPVRELAHILARTCLHVLLASAEILLHKLAKQPLGFLRQFLAFPGRRRAWCTRFQQLFQQPAVVTSCVGDQRIVLRYTSMSCQSLARGASGIRVVVTYLCDC